MYYHSLLPKRRVIGITAGEATNPQVTLRHAVKNIIWRILIFYIGSIFVIVTIYPWNLVDQIGSPFVTTFSKIGIGMAAGIINFVVLTAAMSGCNSGLYCAGRMLYTLSQNRQIPKFLGSLSPNGVPRNSILFTILLLLVGVFLNYIMPNSKLFVYVYSASILPGMIPWFVLIISQFKFRKRWKAEMKTHSFKSYLFPYSNYVIGFFLVMVLLGMGFNPDTRISLSIGAIFIGILTLSYYLTGLHRAATLAQANQLG